MSDLRERLRKNADEHLQVANDCDCNPEATRNYHHYRDDLEAADRIAELEQEITIEKSKQFLLAKRCDSLAYKLVELEKQLAERDALIERMRDALIECLDDSHQVLSEYEQLYSATYRPQRLEAQKAIVSEAQAVLALTQPQALAEHDAEVRRKVLEEAAQDKGST